MYVARAANTGVSGVIDPFGRVRARSALFERTAVVHDVVVAAPSGGGRTFYARHGDLFAWGCLVVASLVTSGAAGGGRGRSAPRAAASLTPRDRRS